MEKIYYELRIDSAESAYDSISKILKLPLSNAQFGWHYQIQLDKSNENEDVINEILNYLEGKYSELSLMGIERNDISIWLIYGFEQQCNMEFSPKNLLRLGQNGITFCISCYNSGY